MSIPRIDVLSLFHNESSLVADYLESVGSITIPFNLFLLDNGSSDGTPDLIGREIEKVAPRPQFLRSLRNNGFARGMNLLSQQGTGDYIFVLNPDTRLDPGCLEKLVERAESDPRIAICEARQAPMEHPKAFDPDTGETTWCSGAAALIRRRAFEEVGRFDEKLFFMYCEDVDLSWKLWLRDWKCVYVPDALVNHYTGGFAGQKSRTQENYFSFRNSLFLYHRFRQKGESSVFRKFLLHRFVSRRYSWRSKSLFAIAFADHIRYIPYLIRSRREWGERAHRWVRLSETSLSD